MKKKILAAAALVIVLAILAVGTAAYSTNRIVVHNVITTGGVTIELLENMLDADGKTEIPYKNPEGTLVPGQSVSKIVRVKNLDEEAFIRVKVETTITGLKEGTDPDFGGTVYTGNEKNEAYNTDAWKLGTDGWYYYQKALAADETTEPLFDEVVLVGKDMGNGYQGATISMEVKAEAVQTANNGTDPMKAEGWGT